MNNDNLFMSADLQGRIKVIYALQMLNNNLIIKSMPLHSQYDLEVWPEGKEDEKIFIEVKERSFNENKFDTAFLDPTKWEPAKKYGKRWFYANIYTDGKIDFFCPATMPESGITETVKYISPTTVIQQKKIPQKRYCLNFNDKCRQIDNKIDILFRDAN